MSTMTRKPAPMSDDALTRKDAEMGRLTESFFAAFKEEAQALVNQKILNAADASAIASAFARIAARQALSLESVHEEALEEIIAEVRRATNKFPTWPTDPLHAVAVLGEEFGELTRAILQLIYEPHKSNAEEVHKEALQTAAMALRLYASLDRYEYKAGIQHEQTALQHSPARVAEGKDVHSTELRK